MNYSGMTSTLGIALSATGRTFPFFSAILGWLGVFLTGSDTSANALFGNLQVITANQIGLNPVLTASVNSAAGVMGKMISLTSIAVACAATGLTAEDEGKLFHAQAQHLPRVRRRDRRDVVRLRVSGRRAGVAAEIRRGGRLKPARTSGKPSTATRVLRAASAPRRRDRRVAFIRSDSGLRDSEADRSL